MPTSCIRAAIARCWQRRVRAQVDRELAQDLVDCFRRAGAVKLFVGTRLHLRGPRRIVVALAHHNDHVHVRVPNPGRRAPE
jgi:hypothetical protein